MTELWPALALAYPALAALVLAQQPATDNERWYLGLERELEAARYEAEFGQPAPARQPFRLSLEFALWRWAHDLRTGRVAGIALGSAVVAGSMAWAYALAGHRAALVTGLVLVSNRYLVGILGTASYVALVAGLWLLGLAGWWHGWPGVAIAAGALLLLLRTSAWGMGLALLALSGPWGWLAAGFVAGYLGLRHPDAVLANGWVTWLRGRVPLHVEHQGVGYAVQVTHNRYVTLAIWALVALLFGHGHPVATAVLALTAVTFVVMHTPRWRLRPKWVVGYLPECAPAFAVAVGLWLR